MYQGRWNVFNLGEDVIQNRNFSSNSIKFCPIFKKKFPLKTYGNAQNLVETFLHVSLCSGGPGNYLGASLGVGGLYPLGQ